VLNVLGQVSPPFLEDGQWIVDAARHSAVTLKNVIDLFTKEVVPTRLDRQRMERINQIGTNVAEVQEKVGQKLVILRGRGGTGKTIRLLQLAKQLYDEMGARVLLLTYNKALVADIRRLLTVSGIQNSLTNRSIQIQTVHSFMYSVLQGIGIFDAGPDEFLANYEKLNNEALSLLAAGALTPEDMDELVQSNRSAFQWDYIFVDEGQDWPDNERNILFRLYSPERFVVADGIDQLVRSREPADWRRGATDSGLVIVPLRKCLRMKAGLARFVTGVAEQLNLPYSNWQPNEEVPGGRVIIVEGSYFHSRSLHDQLLRENADDGNQPIDMLFCVPPDFVSRNPANNTSQSLAATFFGAWGFQVWDGASEDVRDSYPTGIEQLRIVQYDSCRGLEGWTVVNLGLDRFYEWKLGTARQHMAQQARLVPGYFAEDPLAAHLEAARWALIPLTRAMDTLVVQVERYSNSRIYSALKVAAQEYQDFVQWYMVD
jgi:hypothetical protein